MRQAALGNRLAAFEPDESAHVEGDIGKADFNPRACQPDRSDEEGHYPLLMGEYMFDRRADLRFSCIGDPRAFRQGGPFGFLR